MIDYWSCRVDRPIHALDLVGLTHLYQPLVGASAISLYVTLSNQLTICKESPNIESHALLMRLLSFSEKQLFEARYLLEGVGLLNTFHMKDEKQREYYEYELIPPLTPQKFFQSDVLSLTLYRHLGKEKFMMLKERLVPKQTNVHTERKDVTKSFQEVFISISPHEIAQYAEREPETFWISKDAEEVHPEGKYPRWNDKDFTALRLRLGSLINEEEWTESFRAELNELCFLYQLDDWALVKALQNPEVTRRGKVDLERLRDFVREEYYLQYGGRPTVQRRQTIPKPVISTKPVEKGLTEEEKHFQQLEQLSPIELLSFYQDGAKIPDSDLKLVESLVHDYALPHGVVNVLLEYVLYKNDYKLPKALVQKIAGHWKRLRIKTVQEALAQARKEKWESKRKVTSKRPRSPKNIQNKRSQAMPQAVLEQMDDPSTTDQSEQDHQDWLAKRAKINEKLALWEKKKQARMQIVKRGGEWT